MPSNIEEQQRLARVAFRKGDYDTSFRLSEELIQFRDAESHFRCAIILEHRREFERAYRFYDYLRVQFGFYDAYNGCARLILRLRDPSRADVALQYCWKAIEIKDDGISYLLAGRIFEELNAPPDVAEAKRMYRKAAFRRSAWAMRKYARLEFAHGNKLLGVLLHVVVTLLFPLYRLIFGKRSLRMG